MFFKCYIVILINYLIAKSNASIASFITPCKENDNKCIISSGQAAVPHVIAGIPELGIPVSDPIAIDSVRTDGNNLKLGFRNIEMSGVSKCKFVELLRNVENNTIKWIVECPLSGHGQYDLRGKILFIEAFGDGDFEMHTDKIIFLVELKLKEIEQDGQKHWKVTSFDYKYELPNKVFMDFKNLFDGDETRAKPFREVIDHSWKEIIEEVGDPIIKQILTKYINIVRVFLLAIPVNELVLT